MSKDREVCDVCKFGREGRFPLITVGGEPTSTEAMAKEVFPIKKVDDVSTVVEAVGYVNGPCASITTTLRVGE